jgi:hypothetical protein
MPRQNQLPIPCIADSGRELVVRRKKKKTPLGFVCACVAAGLNLLESEEKKKTHPIMLRSQWID